MDWCTNSPDGMLGVEWSLSCMAHDNRYDQDGTIVDKIKADFDLAADIWAIASLADAKWKTTTIRAYSVMVFCGVSVLGWNNWWSAKRGYYG